jgi:hypothetical protein
VVAGAVLTAAGKEVYRAGAGAEREASEVAFVDDEA